MNSLINDPSARNPARAGISISRSAVKEILRWLHFWPMSRTQRVRFKCPHAASSKLEEMADKVAEQGRTRTPYENKFEIRDDFILINDKKIPNDPKMMAAAIKSKLSE